MITSLHVFDMDGTLVDSSHRYETMPCGTRINLAHWIENEHRVMDDKLLPLVHRYRALLADPTAYVVIATARIWCELTAEFVKIHNIEPQTKFARVDRDDTRGGAALKITGIKKLLNLKQFSGVESIHVYEDNKAYLTDICNAFDNTVGYFFESNQGH